MTADLHVYVSTFGPLRHVYSIQQEIQDLFC